MRNLSVRFWVLASILIAVNVGGWLWVGLGGGGDLPRVRLLAVTPTGDLDEADRFTVTFDEPAVAVESCGEPI